MKKTAATDVTHAQQLPLTVSCMQFAKKKMKKNSFIHKQILIFQNTNYLKNMHFMDWIFLLFYCLLREDFPDE